MSNIHVSEIAHSPISYQEATEGPNKKHWKAAMKTEMMSGTKTVWSKWVY